MTAEGVDFAVQGWQMFLKHVRPERGAKVPSAEWSKAAGVALGSVPGA